MLNKIWQLIEKILYFFVHKIFHLKLSNEKWETFLQFVRFGIVGASNTVISYLLYVISLLVMRKLKVSPSVDYLIAQFIGFVLSVLWSFYWNRKMVFKADNDKVPWFQALVKTYISYAFSGLFLSTVLSIIWVQFIGIDKMIAPVLNLVISVPINFILNKFWAFKEK